MKHNHNQGLISLCQKWVSKHNEVSEFTQEGRNFFSEVFNSAAYQIGIREPLDELELKMIFDFLKKQFKTITLDDIRDAFYLYSAQKLEFKNSHYQSLDIVFIGSVLSSYQEYCRVQKVNQKKEIPEQLPMPKEDIKDAYDFVSNFFKENGKLPMFANWNDCFLYMEKEKMFTLSNDDKEIFAENVRDDISSLIIMLKKQKRSYHEYEMVLKESSLFKAECRKKYLEIYFENLKK